MAASQASVKTSSSSGIRRHAAQMHALAAVRREIRSRDSASRSKYLREFTTAFRNYDVALTSKQLNEKLAAADILFLGDYHALAASQHFAAQMVEQLAARRPVVLGVEAVLSRDQQILEAWWRREIGEEELRKRVRFDREWGYDWDPFFAVLMAAREHAEGIYGLDCMPRHDMRRIRSRDRHAAGKICEMRARHPQTALVLLFGESHMAPEHLPRLVKQEVPAERTLTVLQNVDALYWQAVGEGAEAVNVGPDAICVFNSSPLEKYESYRLCLEKWHSDDAPDFAPAIYNLILSLARTLGFRTDSPRNGTQPKQLADSLPEVVSADDDNVRGSLSDKDRAALDERGCVYVQQTNTFCIREFKMAPAAAECARFLRCACRGFTEDNGRDRLEGTLAHFGARLLCPGNLNEEWSRPEEGEQLYDAYLAGKISKAALRRMFLAHGEQPQSPRTCNPQG
jgi:Haem-binding uptake, Tiki superfamily, ChaN